MTSTGRRPTRALCLTLGLALLSSCSSSEAPEPTGEEELYVLLIVDTLRRDALGCYGREEAQTPRIDALAAEGVRFEQAIATSGWTLPSVASMLTGTWPQLHKALGKNTRLTPVTDDLPLAAEVFREAGFGTVGLANAAFLSPILGLDRGFDVFDHRHAYNQEIRRADETVDTALAEVAARPADDLFLLVHLFDAHLDYDPPDGFLDPFVGDRREPAPPLSMKECLELAGDDALLPPAPADVDYARGLYQGEVAFVDGAVGRLVDGLEELGRWERTTLALVSDHGEEFWEHGGFEHGHTLYNELVQVPLLVRTPATAVGATRVVEHQVRTIDIMPTLFELAGVEAPASFEGRSLLDDLRGERPARIPPAFTQGTLYGAAKMSWRTAKHHLIIDQARQGPEAVELYDIAADPRETRNIAAKEPALRDRILAELQAFHGDLSLRARSISVPEIQDLSPSNRDEIMKSLEALGYTGRGEDEDEESSREGGDE